MQQVTPSASSDAQDQASSLAKILSVPGEEEGDQNREAENSSEEAKTSSSSEDEPDLSKTSQNCTKKSQSIIDSDKMSSDLPETVFASFQRALNNLSEENLSTILICLNDVVYDSVSVCFESLKNYHPNDKIIAKKIINISNYQYLSLYNNLFRCDFCD